MITQPVNPPARRRADLVALLALSALVVAFCWKLIFTDLIIARGDLFNYFYPYRDYAAFALREGRLPLWNPYLFMGAPFLANSQAGFFYPLNLIASWLDVTRAINLSIAAHVWIACLGAYALARKRLGASIPAAWLGGASFGLGGYLGAQVEHFNQLQALAWLPWLWLAYERAAADSPSRIRSIRDCLLVGALVGLMLLAGHTQSVFIALVGLAAQALWPAIEQVRDPRRALRAALARLTPLVIGVAVGALLAAVQLLPTVELTGFSPRGGGLSIDEAVSFSLDPRLIGRALLPDYEGALPGGSEYTAFLGVSALVLMVVGLWAGWLPGQRTGKPTLRAISVVAMLGLFLALGGFNPIYYLLVKFAPGFDLFRAPARWLALFAFGASMLAAVGLDSIGRGFTRRTRITSLLPALVIVLLIGSTIVAAGVTPAGASGPIGLPGSTPLILWSLVAIVMLLLARRPQPAASNPSTPLRAGLQPPTSNLQPPTSNFQLPTSNLQLLVVTLCCLELFVATRNLPYAARLTAPDALADLRPSLTQLMAGATDTPPARFLSISDILFDPGDAAELESIFADQLPPDAYYDLLVASKQKEIIAPNLPLYYRLPAVDGYDGGLLPLRHYLAFQRLFLPPDAIQPDGRLREQLKSVPDARWLGLMNVKYVITDKVRDRWLDGVFYDLQFATRLGPGEEVFTDRLPVLEANALGVAYSEPSGDLTLAEAEVAFADGSTQILQLTAEPIAQSDDLAVMRLRWKEAKRVVAIRLRGAGGLTLRGVALIDERSDTFHSFVLAQGGRFRLAHSGDVKVYEYLDTLPRAFVAPQARFASSDEEAIAVMQNPNFDPSRSVVLSAVQPESSSQLSVVSGQLPLLTRHSSLVTRYDPERVVIEVNADSDGYLVLTDAWYPGWTATVDGVPVEILRADVYFRAVRVGPGAHRVEFRYESQTVRVGVAISAGAWAALAAIVLILRVRRGR